MEQKQIEYKPIIPYKSISSQLSSEMNQKVSERQKAEVTGQLIEAGTILPINAAALLGGGKRKPKETQVAYRRRLKNSKKALKVYMKHGVSGVVDPKTDDRATWIPPQIYINKATMEVL